MAIKTHRRKSKSARKGAAIIEAVTTLPIILLIIFSTTEICNRIFLKQSLAVMAYEGARVAIVPDAVLADVELQVSDVAAGRSVKNVVVTVSPSDLSAVVEGEFITVTVTASGTQPLITSLFSTPETSKSVAMMKEN